MRPTSFMGERHDLVSVNPPNPGVGAPLTWNAPDNAVVQVIGVKIALTTSANVGDRHVRVYVATGAAVNLPYSPAMIVQTANLTWTYFFTVGIAPVDVSGVQLEVYQPFGCCYQLQTGSSLIVNANILDGLDQFAAASIRYFLWEKA